MTAVLYGRTEIAIRILKNTRARQGVNYTDRHGRTAFSYACQNCRISIIREFLYQQCISSSEISSMVRHYANNIRKDKTYGYEIMALLNYWAVRMATAEGKS